MIGRMMKSRSRSASRRQSGDCSEPAVTAAVVAKPVTEALRKSPDNILGLVILVNLSVEGEEMNIPFEIISWNSFSCKYMAKPVRQTDYDSFGEIYFDDIVVNSFDMEKYEGIYADEIDEWDETAVDYKVGGNFSGPVIDENGVDIEHQEDDALEKDESMTDYVVMPSKEKAMTEEPVSVASQLTPQDSFVQPMQEGTEDLLRLEREETAMRLAACSDALNGVIEAISLRMALEAEEERLREEERLKYEDHMRRKEEENLLAERERSRLEELERREKEELEAAQLRAREAAAEAERAQKLKEAAEAERAQKLKEAAEMRDKEIRDKEIREKEMRDKEIKEKEMRDKVSSGGDDEGHSSSSPLRQRLSNLRDDDFYDDAHFKIKFDGKETDDDMALSKPVVVMRQGSRSRVLVKARSVEGSSVSEESLDMPSITSDIVSVEPASAPIVVVRNDPMASATAEQDFILEMSNEHVEVVALYSRASEAKGDFDDVGEMLATERKVSANATPRVNSFNTFFISPEEIEHKAIEEAEAASRRIEAAEAARAAAIKEEEERRMAEEKEAESLKAMAQVIDESSVFEEDGGPSRRCSAEDMLEAGLEIMRSRDSDEDKLIPSEVKVAASRRIYKGASYLGRQREDRQDEELKELSHLMDESMSSRLLKGVGSMAKSRGMDHEMDEVKKIVKRQKESISRESSGGLPEMKAPSELQPVRNSSFRSMMMENTSMTDSPVLQDISPMSLSNPLSKMNSSVNLLDTFLDVESKKPFSWGTVESMAEGNMVEDGLSAAMEENRRLKNMLKTAALIKNMSGESEGEQKYGLDEDTLLRIHRKLGPGETQIKTKEVSGRSLNKATSESPIKPTLVDETNKHRSGRILPHLGASSSGFREVPSTGNLSTKQRGRLIISDLYGGNTSSKTGGLFTPGIPLIAEQKSPKNSSARARNSEFKRKIKDESKYQEIIISSENSHAVLNKGAAILSQYSRVK